MLKTIDTMCDISIYLDNQRYSDLIWGHGI